MRNLTAALACVVVAIVLSGCRTGLDFSPDGRQLVVIRKSGLAIINADGTGKRAVPNSSDGHDPLWSPDGRHILFRLEGHNISSKGRGGFKIEYTPSLMLYDVRGQTTRALPFLLSAPFAWREDGARLAGIRSVSGSPEELVVCSMPDGDPALRVRLVPKMSVTDLHWIPGTDDLACIARNELTNLTRKDQRDNVYLIERGEFTKITTTNDIAALVVASDGKRLLWARWSPSNSKRLTLHSYDLADRTSVQLSSISVPALRSKLPPSAKMFLFAGISPNTKKVALLAMYSAKPIGKSRDERIWSFLYSLNLDGSGARLVRGVGPIPPDGLLWPKWSRDGKRIAIMEILKKRTTVTVYNADGTGGRVISSE